MSTRSKRKTGISGAGRGADFGDDDPTIVEDPSVKQFDTPVTMPRCQECGAVVFFDDFDAASLTLATMAGVLGSGRCIRARDGHWWICAHAIAHADKVTFVVPHGR